MNSSVHYSEILKRYWGYSSFRSIQEEIIRSVCEGKDTLGLMPTGGGKSITFQVPALAMDGICIVVTPLIALMKDQVQNLRRRGIKAAAIFSGMTFDEIDVTLNNCIFGNYKFLYVSPERLSSELFIAKVQQMNVNLLTIDESHCISQWGYDFRPSYLKIADIREYLPGVPVLALTATATPSVVKDIQQRLLFKEENLFSMSFARQNLAYRIKYVEDKQEQLLRLIRITSGSTIVYVRSRKKTKEYTDLLLNHEFTATYYHAGLSNSQKDNRQKEWQENKIRIIVCTNAFGMGIDKPDVRLVIHLDLPDSPEAYFQEAGRGGRDGLPAQAVMLVSKRDRSKLHRRIEEQFPTRDFIKNVYDSLNNFLQVGIGEGFEQAFDFNISSFCTAFKLPIITSYHALKLLEHSGYIELTDEQDNNSRVMFTVEREELYRLREVDRKQDALIHLLLRTYTGLFSEFAYIDDEQLSQRLSITTQEFYQIMLNLTRAGILRYIPHKRTPFIIYKERRTESRYIIIPRSAYEERKERYEERINAMINFAYEEQECRSILLLRYFGEKEEKECGVCDICMTKKRKELVPQEITEWQKKITEKLQDGPLFVKQLTDSFVENPKVILPIIRKMIDDSALILRDGELYLP